MSQAAGLSCLVCMSEEIRHQTVALVTGANNGTGRGAAEQLAGYVATDSNAHGGCLTVAQGAAVLVRLATLDPDGPTAGFFGEEGRLPW